MKYRLLGNYKYQIVETYTFNIDIKGIVAGNKYIRLNQDGELTINKGYAWDGPSGPTIDTSTFMRGSLVHDALYQLMREEFIGIEYRDYADKILKQMCIECGMSKFRAWYVYQSLKWFGRSNVKPKEKLIYIVP